MTTERPEPCILVVEDDPTTRLMLRACLEASHLQVIECVNLDEARRAFAHQRPDLVILDVMLPDGNGLDLCRAWRQMPGGETLPIMVATGLNDLNAVRAAYDAGTTDFITKPIHWGMIGYRVQCLLRAHATLLALEQSEARNRTMVDQLRLAARVFEASHEGILITDHQHHIVSVNPRFEQMSGYSVAELQQTTPWLLGAGQEHASLYRNLLAVLYETGAWEGELTDRRRNGDYYPAWVSISLVRDAGGEVQYLIISVSDMTERKRQDARIEYLAFHDALTGLPNRRLLLDRVQVAISQAQRDNDRLALLFIDLDHFKHINDTLGHQMGDQLLREVGLRLRQWVRGGDTVSRVGGDEFIILCPGCQSMEDAALLAEKLLQALGQPYQLEDKQLVVTASIGISLYPDNGTDANTLIGNADSAMYLAKEHSRNNCQFYSPELNQRNLERLQMEQHLHRALDNGEFELFFQPKVNATSGQLAGAEVLMRWRDPSLGLVLPGRFIPLAEETGQIQQLNSWLLQETCAHLARWRRLGLPQIPLSINLSRHQLQQRDFISQLHAMLVQHQLTPADIELELTEQMLSPDIPRLQGVLTQLHQAGSHLTIDDFGTGFSNLNGLRHLPLRALKIHQSFVHELGEEQSALAVIDAMIALAHALGMQTIAEGVETEPQRAILQRHRCDVIQGYLVAAPMDERDFLAWCRAYQPAPVAESHETDH